MIDSDVLKTLLETWRQDYRLLLGAILVLMVLNLVLELVRFLLQIKLSNKDHSNQRKLLVEQRRLVVLEELFNNLSQLRLLDRTQPNEMLAQVTKIADYMNSKRLYIPKKFHRASDDILDYFKTLMTDYTQKDVKLEVELFENFCHLFND